MADRLKRPLEGEQPQSEGRPLKRRATQANTADRLKRPLEGEQPQPEGRPKRRAAQANTAVRTRALEDAERDLSHAIAVEALVDLSMLPPKIQKVLNDVKVNAKADKLQTKYAEKPVDVTSPMSIAVRTWGPEAVANFLQHRDAVRYMYSPTNNTTQCIRAKLGDPSDPQKAANMTCWLCGFLLFNPRTGTAYDTIACEHVLPVYQAVMYADIALAKKPSTSTEELVASEYGWAHTVCNGPKSNRVFIVENRDRSNNLIGWKIDGEIIRQTLLQTADDIIEKGIDGGTLRTDDAKTKWVDKCIKNITVRLNVILGFLNHPDRGGHRLSHLFSVSKLVDPERWASNVNINEAAYDAYAERLVSEYDAYMDRIVGDALRDSNVLQHYPELYKKLSEEEWNRQAGRRRTKRKRQITHKRKNNKRK